MLKYVLQREMNVCRPYSLLEVPVNIFRHVLDITIGHVNNSTFFFSISPTICQSGMFSVSFQEKQTNIVMSETIRASPSGYAQPQKCQQASGLWRI